MAAAIAVAGFVGQLLGALPQSALTPGALPLGALHLGDLHPFERVLVGIIAIGPFVVLAVVVFVVRRRDLESQPGDSSPPSPPDG